MAQPCGFAASPGAQYGLQLSNPGNTHHEGGGQGAGKSCPPNSNLDLDAVWVPSTLAFNSIGSGHDKILGGINPDRIRDRPARAADAPGLISVSILCRAGTTSAPHLTVRQRLQVFTAEGYRCALGVTEADRLQEPLEDQPAKVGFTATEIVGCGTKSEQVGLFG